MQQAREHGLDDVSTPLVGSEPMRPVQTGARADKAVKLRSSEQDQKGRDGLLRTSVLIEPSV
jgi:hypothetical protein